MESEIGNDSPLRVGRFTPDENFAIVGGGCEDGAVFGMCLVKTGSERGRVWGGEMRTDP